jgi:hypothetical protein
MFRILLALLAFTVTFGCSSSNKPSTVGNARTGAAALSGDVLSYLPATTRVVIHTDLEAIRKTPFGAKADAFLSDALAEGGQRLDVSRVASFTWALTDDRHVMVVRGPTLDDVLELFARWPGGKPRIDRDGPLARIVWPDGEQMTFAYPEERTIVFYMFEARPPDADLRKLVDDGAPLRSSPDFLARFGKVSSGQIWAISNADPYAVSGPLMAPAIPSLRGELRTAGARIAIGDRVAVEAQYVAPDDKAAAELVTLTRDDQAKKAGLIGELLALATAPQVHATGNTVLVAFSLTPAQVALGHDAWQRAFQQAGK